MKIYLYKQFGKFDKVLLMKYFEKADLFQRPNNMMKYLALLNLRNKVIIFL